MGNKVQYGGGTMRVDSQLADLVSKSPYRHVTANDIRLWEVVEEDVELLEALPNDGSLQACQSLLGSGVDVRSVI